MDDTLKEKPYPPMTRERFLLNYVKKLLKVYGVENTYRVLLFDYNDYFLEKEQVYNKMKVIFDRTKNKSALGEKIKQSQISDKGIDIGTEVKLSNVTHEIINVATMPSGIYVTIRLLPETAKKIDSNLYAVPRIIFGMSNKECVQGKIDNIEDIITIDILEFHRYAEKIKESDCILGINVTKESDAKIRIQKISMANSKFNTNIKRLYPMNLQRICIINKNQILLWPI